MRIRNFKILPSWNFYFVISCVFSFVGILLHPNLCGQNLSSKLSPKTFMTWLCGGTQQLVAFEKGFKTSSPTTNLAVPSALKLNYTLFDQQGDLSAAGGSAATIRSPCQRLWSSASRKTAELGLLLVKKS